MLMSGKRYDDRTKERVALLRSQGKSYAEIRKEFPIPKSTLSVWLGEKYAGIFDRKAQLAHLKKIRVIAARAKTAGRLQREQVASEAARAAALAMPLDDVHVLKGLLGMLYWAEGTRAEGTAGVCFVNTDPKLIALYLKLLRTCFLIDERRVRIRIHLHYYHKKREALKFWSSVTGVPLEQFGKLHIKKRSKTRKFRKNFMGICFVYYSSQTIRKEIIEMGKEIHAILCPRK